MLTFVYRWASSISLSWGWFGRGAHTVSVNLPHFRCSSSPSLLHKAVETSGGPVTQTCPEDDCLPGRCHCVQSDSGGYIAGQRLYPLVTQEEKMSQLIQSCRDLIQEKAASVRTLAKIIGKLAGKSYEKIVLLNQNCQNDLQRWVDQISTWNGRSIITPAPDLVITTDASLQGWGAVCQGVWTRGLWSQQESNTLHINALELKAALFAVRAFTAKERHLHVHLRMDNRTAVTCVLKMGGTRSSVLVEIAQELWGYALSKQITLTAEHLPGRYNQAIGNWIPAYSRLWNNSGSPYR